MSEYLAYVLLMLAMIAMILPLVALLAPFIDRWDAVGGIAWGGLALFVWVPLVTFVMMTWVNPAVQMLTGVTFS